jgi:hypothetical protein
VRADSRGHPPDCELLKADLRVLEARLTLRFTLMVIAWVTASAILIINR